MSCLLGLGALQWREVNQKPSAFESPPRLAWGALRSSSLGLGDTPSSHTNLPDPRSPRTQGWCYKSGHLQSWLAGAGNRPSLLESDPRSPKAWEGGRKPLKPDTSCRRRNFAGWWVGGSRAVIAGMCSHQFGVCWAARLRKGSETWMWGRRLAAREPGLEPGFGCERSRGAASTEIQVQTWWVRGRHPKTSWLSFFSLAFAYQTAGSDYRRT